MDNQEEPFTSIAEFTSAVRGVKAVQLVNKLDDSRLIVRFYTEEGAKRFEDTLGQMFAMMAMNNLDPLSNSPEDNLALSLSLLVCEVDRQSERIALTIRSSPSVILVYGMLWGVRTRQLVDDIYKADEEFNDRENDGTYSDTSIGEILQRRNKLYSDKRIFEELSNARFDPDNPDDNTIEQKLLRGDCDDK